MGNCYSPRSRVVTVSSTKDYEQNHPEIVNTQNEMFQHRVEPLHYSSQFHQTNGDLRREQTFHHERLSQRNEDLNLRKRPVSAGGETSIQRQGSLKRTRQSSGSSHNRIHPNGQRSPDNDLLPKDFGEMQVQDSGILSAANTSRATSQFSIANTSRVQIENLNLSEYAENGMQNGMGTPTLEVAPIFKKTDRQSRESSRPLASPIREESKSRKPTTRPTVKINEKPNEKTITPSPKAKSGKTPPSVISMDIGTTFSGYAYGYKSRHTMSVPQKKVPSVILLNPDLSLNSFGFAALKNYPAIPANDRLQYFYIEHFKSVVFNSPRISHEMTVDDNMGRPINALHVFTLAIYWLKEQAISNINYNDGTTQWVITIPSIWAADLRRFVHRAALEAGIPDFKLDIVLEAEAVSYLCRNEYQNIHDYDLSAGTKYAFADLGGGTTNVYVHEILKGNKLRELYRDIQHTVGAQSVNQAYIKFWVDLVGEEIWEEFRVNHPASFMKAMITFEKKKMAFAVGKGERIDIMIEPALDQLLKVKKWASFDKLLKTKPRYKGNVKCKEVNGNMFMYLSIEMMETFFMDSVDKVLRRLMKALALCTEYGIQGLVLTGGFSKSAYLMERIEEELADIDVHFLVPDAQENAVLKGAVMMGNEMFEISERLSRFTYGYSQASPDQKSYAALAVNAKCRLLFRTIIDNGQYLKNYSKYVIKGQEVLSNPNRLFTEKTTRIVKSECVKTKGAERYGMRDEECEVVCEFVHTPPHEGWPIRSEYELIAFCRETEIKFVYLNRTTREKMKTYVQLV
ncbi:heat shock 70 kDa protein 12A-like [Mya arenaria]|uniref:heat shock 70 kDa protein 12A-like n=1 Tax=Mya arenaria TaxID=6604 RepID=UPI0022E65145|nr:heat shock 70 kDa protein 12A-like [Mya arenaria]